MSLRHLLSSSALLLAACGAPNEAPTPGVMLPGAEAEAPAVVEPCLASGVRVAPSEGVPAARTAPLVLSFDGHAPELKVVVAGPEGELDGAVFQSGRGALFVPARPYPAGAVIHWRSNLCGEIHEGSFATGALHRGLDLQEMREIYGDRAWAVDLRAASWGEPRAAASSRLSWALGGAVLVEMTPLSSKSVLVRLAPAHADASGVFAQVEAAPVVESAVEIDEGGAYLRFRLDALALPSRGGLVRLRDVDVTLGLSEDGPADGRVVAEMDLRDWRGENGREGCAYLEDEAGVECGPCAQDGEVACAALDLGGVYGTPSELRVLKGP